jgi:membrane fusion protein, multidrug efflux system
MSASPNENLKKDPAAPSEPAVFGPAASKPEVAAPANSVENNQANRQADPPPNNHRSHIIWWVTIVLILIAIGWACLWLFYFQYHKFTDDAYANGSMITINAVVPGSVVAFFADDTDLVNEGQLLVLLDPTNYQIEYEKQLASLAASVLQVRQLYDTVKANRANKESKRVKLGKARFDYDNRAKLVDSLAVSNEDFIHAKDDLTIAEQELKQAEYQLQVSLDAAGNTPQEKHPLIEEQKAAVREAFYNLQHCSIYAPATGYVAQRSVDVGERVALNTALMAVIPTDYVWVDANFKETQLTYMRVGQPASVTFDLYGSDVEFEGKVLGIASGSGSVFSLIPPQNATGNWIKIVQRLPVRISLNPEKVKRFPVRLGISAEVDVNVTNQDLPMLVQTTSKKPVATTRVFTINLDEVDQAINQVIHNNSASLKEG